MTELLNCPFCGQAPFVDDDEDGVCCITCANDDCLGVEITCPTRDDAEAFWNLRTTVGAPAQGHPDGWTWRDYTGRPQIGFDHPGAMAEDPTPLYAGTLAEGGPTSEAKSWRCFHCDEVFTDPKAAANHFGVDHLGSEALCQMAQVDGGIARVIADLAEESR